jgi:hypothetical protein
MVLSSLQTVVVVTSAVSCVFSLGVIVTILSFQKMQKGNFMPIILFMSASDFGMNSTSFIGFPADGSTGCWIQVRTSCTLPFI